MVVAALVPLVPGVAEAGATLLHPQWLALGALVALASSVIPYSLETEALRRMPANVFGVLMSLEPALAALAGFLVLSQALGARDLVAIALVVCAERRRRRARSRRRRRRRGTPRAAPLIPAYCRRAPCSR